MTSPAGCQRCIGRQALHSCRSAAAGIAAHTPPTHSLAAAAAATQNLMSTHSWDAGRSPGGHPLCSLPAARTLRQPAGQSWQPRQARAARTHLPQRWQAAHMSHCLAPAAAAHSRRLTAEDRTGCSGLQGPLTHHLGSRWGTCPGSRQRPESGQLQQLSCHVSEQRSDHAEVRPGHVSKTRTRTARVEQACATDVVESC